MKLKTATERRASIRMIAFDSCVINSVIFCGLALFSGCVLPTAVGDLPNMRVTSSYQLPIFTSTTAEVAAVTVRPRFNPSADIETYTLPAMSLLDSVDENLRQLSDGDDLCIYTLKSAYGDYYSDGTLTLKKVVVVRLLLDIQLDCGTVKTRRIEKRARSKAIELDSDISTSLRDVVAVAVSNAVIDVYLNGKIDSRENWGRRTFPVSDNR